VDELYVTQDQAPYRTSSVLVRTRQDPNNVIKQIVAAVHDLDPDQPVSDIHTLEQLKYQSLAPPRLTSTLLVCFALLALAITGAGIAGVMGLSVSQRTKEIGIRMALGATPGLVLRMVLRQGLVLIVLGLGLGTGMALGGTRLLQGLLFGIEPTDPLTLIGVTILLVAVAAAACYGPARRATSVDPLAALRAD
jgi:putative ABC transport system permease protein